jgi:hypothetical protein
LAQHRVPERMQKSGILLDVLKRWTFQQMLIKTINPWLSSYGDIKYVRNLVWAKTIYNVAKFISA